MAQLFSLGVRAQLPMKSKITTEVALLLVWVAVCGCHSRHRSTQAPRFAQSVSQPKTLAPQRLLPAEQTLSALRDLSPTATLDDVLKITGEPSIDTGSAIHSYGFALDDQSAISIRAQLDGRLISIEHTKVTITKLFPKP